MVTAVDTSVLLDVFLADAEFGPKSLRALEEASREGGLIACEIVWAEVAAAFGGGEEAQAALVATGIEFSPVDQDVAFSTAESWRRYRAAGGKRDRVIADFLIAAHATLKADRLLTRDRGFFRSHFADLEILAP